MRCVSEGEKNGDKLFQHIQLVFNELCQTYHLVNKYAVNEPLFKLILVCTLCREIIANIEIKNETEKI